MQSNDNDTYLIMKVPLSETWSHHEGILYFWGLSIDPLVCMGTVLVVGLCVDYSVHIAHAFSDAEGLLILNAKWSKGHPP